VQRRLRVPEEVGRVEHVARCGFREVSGLFGNSDRDSAGREV
jgi:hypothetical protein